MCRPRIRGLREWLSKWLKTKRQKCRSSCRMRARVNRTLTSSKLRKKRSWTSLAWWRVRIYRVKKWSKVISLSPRILTREPLRWSILTLVTSPPTQKWKKFSKPNSWTCKLANRCNPMPKQGRPLAISQITLGDQVPPASLTRRTATRMLMKRVPRPRKGSAWCSGNLMLRSNLEWRPKKYLLSMASVRTSSCICCRAAKACRCLKKSWVSARARSCLGWLRRSGGLRSSSAWQLSRKFRDICKISTRSRQNRSIGARSFRSTSSRWGSTRVSTTTCMITAGFQ